MATGGRSLTKRLLRRFGLTLLTALLVTLVYAGWTAWQGNYHTVLPGELYRSGQLSPAQLTEHLKQDGIRSIINLRGPAPRDAWYRKELAVAQAHGVAHADVDLSAGIPLSDTQLRDLVALMARLPKPLLLHCLGGADRTGMASALYLYAIKGKPAKQAADQLALRYGHFPYWFRSDVSAMDDSFRRYVSAVPRPAAGKP